MKGKLLQRVTKDIAALGSRYPEVARAAEDRLLRSAARLRRAGPHVIQPLLDVTHHPNPEVRFRAGKVLAATHAPGAYPRVLALTRDPDEFVRWEAVEALGQYGYVEAIDALVELVRLGDQPDCLNDPAGRALWRLGRPSVLPVMALLQHEDPFVRAVAISVLSGIGDQRAIDPVAELLHDPVDWVRRAAVEGLEELGDPEYWNTSLPQPTKREKSRRCIDRCFDLIVACEDDPDEWVRLQAALWRRHGYGHAEDGTNKETVLSS
jgi:bilin biosynthesis protein